MCLTHLFQATSESRTAICSDLPSNFLHPGRHRLLQIGFCSLQERQIRRVPDPTVESSCFNGVHSELRQRKGASRCENRPRTNPHTWRLKARRLNFFAVSAALWSVRVILKLRPAFETKRKIWYQIRIICCMRPVCSEKHERALPRNCLATPTCCPVSALAQFP